jgi:tRNA(Ile)-lysidine synthase
MLDRFINYIRENELCRPEDRILLAVSGGIDSAVMLHLFANAGYNCIVAHCNFKLRGNDSDEDQLFVESLAEKYKLPFITNSFQTTEYAESNKISIQMAARLLRYDWFDEMRMEHDFDLIATAHNKNDSVETFFINLSRGTGIRGLTGIPASSGYLIRPVLFLERHEIEEFALANDLAWREDSSNSQSKYSRNKIRHSIIPSFQELNPGIIKTMAENIARLKDVEDIYLHSLKQIKEKIIIKDKDFTAIHINELKNLEPISTWMLELLKDFDFTAPVCNDIVKNLDSPPGRQFLSLSHRLVKDRDKLIIQPLIENDFRRYYIDDPSMDMEEPISLHFNILDKATIHDIPADPSFAWFDLDKLDFPLMIRKWETGDYFMPLGMRNMKKLSDFFIDNKYSIPEKENTWLLISGDKIAWLIGKRIDERFKIGKETKRILQCKLS